MPFAPADGMHITVLMPYVLCVWHVLQAALPEAGMQQLAAAAATAAVLEQFTPNTRAVAQAMLPAVVPVVVQAVGVELQAQLRPIADLFCSLRSQVDVLQQQTLANEAASKLRHAQMTSGLAATTSAVVETSTNARNACSMLAAHRPVADLPATNGAQPPKQLSKQGLKNHLAQLQRQRAAAILQEQQQQQQRQQLGPVAPVTAADDVDDGLLELADVDLPHAPLQLSPRAHAAGADTTGIATLGMQAPMVVNQPPQLPQQTMTDAPAPSCGSTIRYLKLVGRQASRDTKQESCEVTFSLDPAWLIPNQLRTDQIEYMPQWQDWELGTYYTMSSECSCAWAQRMLWIRKHSHVMASACEHADPSLRQSTCMP